MTDVATGPLGFVAIGWNSLTRAVWRSGDGESWSQSSMMPPASPEDGSFSAVAAGSQGFLAVGAMGEGRGRAAAWFSATGDEWSRVDADLPAGVIADVVTSPDGTFVAIGVDKSGADWNAAVWLVSADGKQWREVTSDALVSPDDDALYRITIFAGGYVAYGQITPQDRRGCPDCDLNPEFWRAYTSHDGSSWDRSVLRGHSADLAVPIPEASPIHVWGDGLIAIGQGDDRRRHIWTSIDGVTWTTFGDPLVLPVADEQFAEVRDVLAADGYLVVGGSLGRGGYVALANAAP